MAALLEYPILNYLLHFGLAILLLAVFFVLYSFITPFDEMLLIRQGNNAAALSLGGALIGYSIALASAIAHTPDYMQFLKWGAGAMLVQVLVYVITTRLLQMSKDHIETGNTAFGGLLGSISLSVGAINGAGLS
ncbi:DUF350 domain-containing protein [soil metagenome]